VYDLTIFKVHCGKVTPKTYTNGDRLLPFEAIAQRARTSTVAAGLRAITEVLVLSETKKPLLAAAQPT